MKKALFVILAGICVFTACKKNDEKPSSDKTEISTLDRMVGKWQFVSEIWYDNTAANDFHATTLGLPSSTMEFSKLGEAYFYLTSDVRSTSSYKVIDDSHFVVYAGGNSDTMQILTLTGDSFIYYNKKLGGSGYRECTITLKK
jgi:hypothetical protein